MEAPSLCALYILVLSAVASFGTQWNSFNKQVSEFILDHMMTDKCSVDKTFVYCCLLKCSLLVRLITCTFHTLAHWRSCHANANVAFILWLYLVANQGADLLSLLQITIMTTKCNITACFLFNRVFTKTDDANEHSHRWINLNVLLLIETWCQSV